MKSFGSLGISLLLLAGCTANEKSIYRNKPLPKDQPSVQSLDAKQRLMIMVPVEERSESNVTQSSTATQTTTRTASSSANAAGTTNTTSTTTITPVAPPKPGDEKSKSEAKSTITTQVRFCAEPSPDVFSVYAGSLAANLDLKKSASPADLALGFGLGITTSEQGSTIARTQTINLLKELMYRTCERYASGGIGKLELAVQSVRDQRVIIAALAIEQLTGTVMPKPTIIGAAGTAGTGADAAGAVVAIDKATTAKASADKARDAADDKLTKAQGDSKLCDDKKDRDKDAAEPSAAQAKACTEAKAEVATATKNAAVATVNLDTLVEASKIGGPIANVAATLFATEGKGGIEKADTSNVAAVANVVLGIVKANYDSSELELLCVKAFDPSQVAVSAAVQQACELYFEAKVENAKKRDDAVAAELIAKASAAAAQSERDKAQSDLEAAQFRRQVLVESIRINSSDQAKFSAFVALDDAEKDRRINKAIANNPKVKAVLEKFRKNNDFNAYRKFNDSIRDSLDIP